ncbi:MAG: hypothetical protein MK078_11680 [Crocinitomicaceae bacterium]|nr:hypothetical protein [Crocinitomicaceae bacterium]
MNKVILKSIGIVVGGLLLSTTFNSCKKESPTTARITVLDTGGLVFPNAMVRLYPTPTIPAPAEITIDDTLFTGPDGDCTFDYTDKFNLGQAGFAVLDIEVRSDDTLYGEGIIKIVEEEANTETVIIQPL